MSNRDRNRQVERHSARQQMLAAQTPAGFGSGWTLSRLHLLTRRMALDLAIWLLFNTIGASLLLTLEF